MYNISLDCTNTSEPVNLVKESLSSKSMKDAIVDLAITVKNPIPSEQRNSIAQLLTETFWHQVFYKRAAPEKRSTKAAFGTTLEPTQALRKYLNSLKISDKDRNLAAKLGQRIIDETVRKVAS
jgi:hypothetical protein